MYYNDHIHNLPRGWESVTVATWFLMALMADREHGYALNHTFTKGYNTCQGSSTPDFWKINRLGLLLPHFSCWGR